MGPTTEKGSSSSADDRDNARKDVTGLAPGRRTSKRQQVRLSALIVDLGKETVVQSRIENVSDTGACIRLSEPRPLPMTFWVIGLPSGLAFLAKKVWREDDRLGVEMGEAVDLRAPTTLSQRRLHKIWTAWQ
jgi:hypothetical protein